LIELNTRALNPLLFMIIAVSCRESLSIAFLGLVRFLGVVDKEGDTSIE
jgi:hypothetical protein